MPASKSSSPGGSRDSEAKPARPRRSTRKSSSRKSSSGPRRTRGSETVASLAEQLANRIINPMGLVVLTRERIQDTLDEAAERGRVTRSDANELAAELFRRGRQQTDDLMLDVEQLLGRGRERIDRAKRAVGVGSSLPISGYDDLTARQVQAKLDGLTPAELRKVRDYERRQANRKSVLGAIEKALR